VNIAWLFVAFPAVLLGLTLLCDSIAVLFANAVGIAGLFVAGFVTHDYITQGRIFDDVFIVGLFGIGYSVPAIGIRRRLNRISRPKKSSPGDTLTWQFTIRHLLITTTAVAVLCALLPAFGMATLLAVLFGCWWLVIIAIFIYGLSKGKAPSPAIELFCTVILALTMVFSTYRLIR